MRRSVCAASCREPMRGSVSATRSGQRRGGPGVGQGLARGWPGFGRGLARVWLGFGPLVGFEAVRQPAQALRARYTGGTSTSETTAEKRDDRACARPAAAAWRTACAVGEAMLAAGATFART